MGKIISILQRPFINYAIEVRVDRYLKTLESKRPDAHPLHPTDQRLLDSLQKEHPDLKELIDTKDARLDKFLKQIKVTSQDSLPAENLDKKLPTFEQPLNLLAFPPEQRPVKEGPSSRVLGLPIPKPDRIPPGKLAFNQLLELWQTSTKHQDIDNSDYEAALKLAQEKFQLNVKQAEACLKFFRPFVISMEFKHRPIQQPREDGITSDLKSWKEIQQDDQKMMADQAMFFDESRKRIENVERAMVRLETDKRLKQEMEKSKKTTPHQSNS